ncbi:hypothetical protein [Deinococcus altitudinis]|uniref:hypothetical protein n=1 Tax=Deinococcus altitudinis TaxID=468914 RepID=UPI00389228DE
MSELDKRSHHSDLETRVFLKIKKLLEDKSEDSSFKIEASEEICFLLEVYIPEMLSKKYSMWESESLDGILVERANKVKSHEIEIIGACILISDQTLTPFALYISIDTKHEKIDSYKILVGEPGSGRLKISGPPVGSMKAHKMLSNITRRLFNIAWSYSLISEER